MSKLFILLINLLIVFSSSAQCTLKISYNYEGGYAQEIPDHQLYINGEEAVYVMQNDKIVATTEKGYRITVPRRDSRRYFNTKSLQIIEVDLTKRKNNTMESVAKPYDWHITDETKEILGYKVIKALAVSKNPYVGGYVVAWFAPDLPCTAGPVELWGLPGVILEYQYQEAPDLRYFATDISFEEDLNIKEIAGLNKEKRTTRKRDKRRVDAKMRNIFSQ